MQILFDFYAVNGGIEPHSGVAVEWSMNGCVHITILCLVAFTIVKMGSCRPENAQMAAEPNVIEQKGVVMETPTQFTEDHWRKRLTPFQYRVLREKGTERAFSGKYTTHFKDGVYRCAACGQALFESESKFHSGCGWPSFSQPLDKNSVTESLDTSHGMVRTEITCSNCGSHLGHVFPDGPKPTGLRYCINSVSIDFEGEKINEK
jgi:peptide-methionine (R)-S-oxide reductase